MKKVWTILEIRRMLRGNDPECLERAVAAIERCHVADADQGFHPADAAVGLRLARLIQRGFRLTDLPALHQWARREMLKYAGRLARIANGRR